MRGFGILLFAGMVFLAGAAYYALSGMPSDSIKAAFGNAVGRGIQTKTLPPPAPLDVLEEVNRKKVQAEKRQAARRSAPPAPLAPLAEAEILIADPPPPPAAPPAPFPTAEDIQVGTPRNSMEQSFGVPYLKTTAMRRDGMLETWVYVENQNSLATFAQVQNGRVISSHTTVY
jgi:hypothetical protein